MALQTRLAKLYEAGNAWLADCSVHPDLVRQIWDADDLAPIPSGERWLVAESHLSAGYLACARLREGLRGPVLADAEMDRAWWLVPPGAAEELADLRQIVVQPAGWPLSCPSMDSYVRHRFWLWRPDGSGQLTDPTVLAAAFGPGGYRPPAEASA